MDNPPAQIEGVIRLLTQSTPSTQLKTIDTYFTPDAGFTHPFCRTGSFDGSRFLIQGIYRWYKILSPHIDLDINSIAYDQSKKVLYVNISQVFSIWFIPFYKAPVTLTTVLNLRHDSSSDKYYISSQNDLYQTNEFVKFFWPGGFILVWIWQVLATLLCLAGAFVCFPITWLSDNTDVVVQKAETLSSEAQYRVRVAQIELEKNVKTVQGEVVSRAQTMRAEVENNVEYVRGKVEENYNYYRGEAEKNAAIVKNEAEKNAEYVKNEADNVRSEAEKNARIAQDKAARELKAAGDQIEAVETDLYKRAKPEDAQMKQ